MRKTQLSPEALLYQLEITFARVMNYPKNKKYQADLVKLEQEILRRMNGDYDKFKEM